MQLLRMRTEELHTYLIVLYSKLLDEQSAAIDSTFKHCVADSVSL